MVYRVGFYGLIVAVVMLGAIGLGVFDRSAQQGGAPSGMAVAAPLAADNGGGDNGGGDNGGGDNGGGDNGGGDNGDNGSNNEANVKAEKLSDSPDPVGVGQTVTFKATIRNDGPETANDTRLNFKLDPSWAFEGASSDEGSCTFESAASRGTLLSRVRCETGKIKDGDSVTARITVHQTAAGVFVTKAKAKLKDTDKTDPDLGNNGIGETTTVN